MPVYSGMAFEQATPDRSMGSPESDDLDWDAIYADQAPRVYNYFRFRMGIEVDVAELTSRTFERAWRSRARYRRDIAGFATWLFTIAKNVGVDYLQGQRSHLPVDAALDVAAEGTPEKDAERRSDLSRLALLTQSLSDRESELIALKYGAELTNRLIAGLTGLSESNVGSILHRVVRSLREKW
jgi:RNA polymerase sigma-70 factor (ECF subfamily)